MRRRLMEIGLLGTGWLLSWAAFGAALSIVVGIVDPPSIDPGEGPVDVARILGGVGGGTGIVFGLLIWAAERRRTIPEIPLVRALLWGILAGAALPLLTDIEDSVLANTCPLGALSAVLSVTLARWTHRVARALA